MLSDILMSLPRGARLASYEIIDLIGSGGMGEVYRPRDLDLGRGSTTSQR